MNRIILICSGLLLLINFNLSAKEYHVSLTGSDENPGILTAPFRTIQKGANAALAGDTVMVSAGFYDEQKVSPAQSGTADKPITFIASGQVILQGFMITNVSYIRIQGFEITNNNYTVTNNGERCPMFLQNSHYIEIVGNYIHDVITTGSGFIWAGVDPDWIAVGNTINAVQIDSIDLSNNTIILKTPIIRAPGYPVWLHKDSSGRQVLYGNAPDIGAYEYIDSNTAPQPGLSYRNEESIYWRTGNHRLRRSRWG